MGGPHKERVLNLPPEMWVYYIFSFFMWLTIVCCCLRIDGIAVGYILLAFWYARTILQTTHTEEDTEELDQAATTEFTNERNDIEQSHTERATTVGEVTTVS